MLPRFFLLPLYEPAGTQGGGHPSTKGISATASPRCLLDGVSLLKRKEYGFAQTRAMGSASANSSAGRGENFVPFGPEDAHP